MTQISREEAVRRVHAFYDALDVARGANDPETATGAKEAAFKAYQRLDEIGTDLAAERLGAARLVRNYFSPSSAWGGAFRDAASLPVARAAKNMSQDEVAGQRWMLARFIIDHAERLPPGLAINAAGALLSLNLGTETPFTKPFRVKGLQHGVTPKATLHFINAQTVYYLRGHRDLDLNRILLDEVETFGGMSLDNLNSIVHRLKIREMVKLAEEKGRADKAAGRAEQPPLPQYLDLALLATLNKSKTG